MARDTITKRAAEPEAGTDYLKDEETQGTEIEARTRRVVKDDGEESPVSRGWSANKRTSSSKTPQFKVPDDGSEVLMKFLEEDAFAAFFQHWFRERKEKPNNFVCLGKSCPLCAMGDVPKGADYFNVVDLSDPANPVLKVWYASKSPSQAIKERQENKRTSPINKADLYFAASKTKEQFPSYSIDPVKASDLEDDWDAKPLTTEQIDEFLTHVYDDSIVKISTKRELEAVVEELS